MLSKIDRAAIAASVADACLDLDALPRQPDGSVNLPADMLAEMRGRLWEALDVVSVEPGGLTEDDEETMWALIGVHDGDPVTLRFRAGPLPCLLRAGLVWLDVGADGEDRPRLTEHGRRFLCGIGIPVAP